MQGKGPRKKTVPSWHVRKEAFVAVRDGRKDVFLVPATPRFRRLVDEGRPFRLINWGTGAIIRRVRAWMFYPDIDHALQAIDLSRVCHGDPVQTQRYLERIYRPDELDLGVLAIELEPLDRSP